MPSRSLDWQKTPLSFFAVILFLIRLKRMGSSTMKNIGYAILTSCTLAVVLSFFSPVTQAQTRPHHKPKPLATPTRVLTGAEIISQGGSDDEPTLVPVDKPVPRPS